MLIVSFILSLLLSFLPPQPPPTSDGIYVDVSLYAPDGVLPDKLLVYTVQLDPGIVELSSENMRIENVKTADTCIDNGENGSQLCYVDSGILQVVTKIATVSNDTVCGELHLSITYKNIPAAVLVRTPYDVIPVCEYRMYLTEIHN